jgi:hypothetical protein
MAVPSGVAGEHFAGGGYKVVRDFCSDLSLCRRGHAVFHEDQWFNAYCFADPGHAEKFKLRFGGEWFDPRLKGKGSNRARWRRVAGK